MRAHEELKGAEKLAEFAPYCVHINVIQVHKSVFLRMDVVDVRIFISMYVNVIHRPLCIFMHMSVVHVRTSTSMRVNVIRMHLSSFMHLSCSVYIVVTTYN